MADFIDRGEGLRVGGNKWSREQFAGKRHDQDDAETQSQSHSEPASQSRQPVGGETPAVKGNEVVEPVRSEK